MNQYPVHAVLLDGSHEGDLHAAAITAALADSLPGWVIEPYTLRDHKIGYCIGCFGCWTKTPGECIIKDDNRTIAAAIINSDLLILLTPVTFGGYSSELKKMLDHFIPLVTPFFTRIDGETHHVARYVRFPAMLTVGYLPRAHDTYEHTFRRLTERNAINFHAPLHTPVIVHTDDDPTPPALHAALRHISAEVIA